jgi:hypothetical protein
MPAAVLKIGGDARGAEAVIDDLGGDAGRQGPTADHRIRVGLGQRGMVSSRVPRPIVRSSARFGSSVSQQPSIWT